ncbi:MAG: Lrp/AsnC family transcriptional regulator [Rhodospirillales bacterium]|nr:Lrp/AsnC family transcriptional regulator [Rhodospirillales bacterium]
MRRVKLDKIDQRILFDLQSDGRISNVELARRAGISAPPCLRRVRALERAGYVRGYHADLEPKALGFNVTVFAHVGLSSQAEVDLQAFEARVASWPEVRECYMLAGETDFLLKVMAEDWDAYERFLTNRLTAAPNVTHVKSALSIRTSKAEPGVPITAETLAPDEAAKVHGNVGHDNPDADDRDEDGTRARGEQDDAA